MFFLIYNRLSNFYRNSTCFLRTCEAMPGGCLVDTDTPSSPFRIVPLSGVVCDANGTVQQIFASLKDNSRNISAVYPVPGKNNNFSMTNKDNN